jgi:hypothetical protein
MPRPENARRAPARAFVVSSLSLILWLMAAPAAALVVDFEDVGASLPSGSFVRDTPFSSQGVAFDNLFTDFGGGFSTWAGFAYSNVQDVTTPGFVNQYAAYTLPPATMGNTHAVGFVDTFVPFLPRITFSSDVQAETVKVTNATYAALSMRDGDAFAKKFGGASGSDPDFFRLTIEGFDAASRSTGTIDFLLADYRFADDAQDYIVSAFTEVDLTSLGTVRSLAFTLDSSDVGPFGLNTPLYFALDDLVVVTESGVAAPEPGAGLLYAVGLVALGLRLRREVRR